MVAKVFQNELDDRFVNKDVISIPGPIFMKILVTKFFEICMLK